MKTNKKLNLENLSREELTTCVGGWNRGHVGGVLIGLGAVGFAIIVLNPVVFTAGTVALYATSSASGAAIGLGLGLSK